MNATIWFIIENIVIYLVIGAVTLGGVALGAGWWGLVSLVLLVWANTGLRIER